MNKYIYTRLLLRTLYVYRSNLKSGQYLEGTKKERKNEKKNGVGKRNSCKFPREVDLYRDDGVGGE